MTAPKTYQIAVLAGDGIGPEVMAATLPVLRAAAETLREVRFEYHELSVGAGEYLRNGDPLPSKAFARAQECDAILLGAMGLPDVRWPNGLEMVPQLDLRERLDLYCGLRPIRLYHPQDTPLKKYQTGEIDLLIVRESTEGLFSARARPVDFAADETWDEMRISRKGSGRLFRAAFQQALQRRSKVTLVDKANVLPSMAYFRRIFDQVASEFPSVQTERVYVDAAALYFVQRPESFDVVVTENMFGDILSDLAAGLVGGMGMAPSADVGDQHAVFQPSHGSAPDIAGKGIANPVATILSAALMLEWLAHPETMQAAERIRAAVQRVLKNPVNRTRDLGGHRTTEQMGQLIAEAVVVDPV